MRLYCHRPNEIRFSNVTAAVGGRRETRKTEKRSHCVRRSKYCIPAGDGNCCYNDDLIHSHTRSAMYTPRAHTHARTQTDTRIPEGSFSTVANVTQLSQLMHNLLRYVGRKYACMYICRVQSVWFPSKFFNLKLNFDLYTHKTAVVATHPHAVTLQIDIYFSWQPCGMQYF